MKLDLGPGPAQNWVHCIGFTGFSGFMGRIGCTGFLGCADFMFVCLLYTV